MAATEKDVEQARKRVDRLTEQLAEERAKASARVTEAENEVRVARLNAEADRLEAELAAVKEANSAKAVRDQTQAAVAAVTSEPGASAEVKDEEK